MHNYHIYQRHYDKKRKLNAKSKMSCLHIYKIICVIVFIVIMLSNTIKCDQLSTDIVDTMFVKHMDALSSEPNLKQREFMLKPENLFNYKLASQSPSINLQTNTITAIRSKRSINTQQQLSQPQQAQLTDACPSKVELITPYYATNSKGKLRTLVHSELMQQAIQVETCQR